MINQGVEIISNFIKQYIDAVTEKPGSVKVEVSQRTYQNGDMMTVFTVCDLTRQDASLIIGFSGYNIEALRFLVERIGIRQNVGTVRIDIMDPVRKHQRPRFLENRVRR